MNDQDELLEKQLLLRQQQQQQQNEIPLKSEEKPAHIEQIEVPSIREDSPSQPQPSTASGSSASALSQQAGQ